MSSDNFAQKEQHYLYIAGRDFVDNYPQISQFLAEPSFDADINRLLDGFTYLSGRLNARLELEYPQLTSSLMNMLWPNYLQQTPSITMMEFSTSGSEAVQVVAGAMLESQVLSKHDVPCQFSVTRDTWVSPFAVKYIEKSSHDSISMQIKADNIITLSTTELNKIRLYCGQDQHSGYQLYLWLSEYLQQASIVVAGHEIALPDLSFTPVGFDYDDGVLSYPRNTFSGYRLLHEYFCYPEGFLFFQLAGFSEVLNGIEVDQFLLKLQFKRPLPSTVKMVADSLKTNCVPAINLFYHECEPINLDGLKTDYPLIVKYKNSDNYELFAIDKVMGYSQQGKVRHYSLFDSFQHQLVYEQGGIPLYYNINQRQNSGSDAIHYSLSFVRGDEPSQYDQEEIIMVHARCSNNNKAQDLRIGDVCIAGANMPSSVSFKNIAYPSKVMRPVLDKRQQWTTISSLSLNYLSLLNKASLTQLVQNYNFTAGYSRRAAETLTKLTQSIISFEAEPCRYPYEDLTVQGYQSSLKLSPAAFNNEGEMYLFGAVIAHFYSQYATVNTFHMLNLINSSTNEVYQWPLMNT